MMAAVRNGRRYAPGATATVVAVQSLWRLVAPVDDHHLNFLQINLPLGHDTYVHPAAASREPTNTSSSKVIRLHLYVYMSDGDSICKIRYIATHGPDAIFRDCRLSPTVYPPAFLLLCSDKVRTSSP